ncbi:MAG TPA: ABC transporter permease [Candidatus Acidoferrales bacterium]|nr:ABC transporter permease [Candidatus Acidoferrales bacterium]
MSARYFMRYVLPPIVPAVVVTLIAELAVRQGWVRSFLIPAPSQVIESLIRDWPELWSATLNTADASLAGFGMSIVIGSLIAIGMSSAPWVQRAFYPYAVFFQTVPIIAIAPLLVIWFGWNRTVVASAFIVSIFPIIANTLTGLLSTDPALHDLFRLYDAKRLATLFKLRLPFALPHVMTGLRIAAGLAVIGAIVGEFITGAGIGGSIMVSRQQNRVDKVFAGLLLASLLGIGLFMVINLISRLALRHWHASEAGE